MSALADGPHMEHQTRSVSSCQFQLALVDLWCSSCVPFQAFPKAPIDDVCVFDRRLSHNLPSSQFVRPAQYLTDISLSDRVLLLLDTSHNVHAFATVDNMSVIERLRMGVGSSLVIVSTLEVITVRNVMNGSESNSILGTMSDAAVQNMWRAHLNPFQLHRSEYMWVESTLAWIEDRHIPEGRLMCILSTKPLMVKGIRGGDGSVLIIGHVTLQTIEMVGQVMSMNRCAFAETGCYVLVHKSLLSDWR